MNKCTHTGGFQSSQSKLHGRLPNTGATPASKYSNKKEFLEGRSKHTQCAKQQDACICRIQVASIFPTHAVSGDDLRHVHLLRGGAYTHAQCGLTVDRGVSLLNNAGGEAV